MSPEPAPAMPNVVGQTLPQADANVATALASIDHTVVARNAQGVVVPKPYTDSHEVDSTVPTSGAEVPAGAEVLLIVRNSA